MNTVPPPVHRIASSPSGLGHPLQAGACVATCALLLAACGGDDGTPAPPSAVAGLGCDESIKSAFASGGDTKLLLVKSFKKGDSLALPGTPATPAPTPAPMIASADVCMVKLLVGPGNAGPAGAPSTSAGIAIEAWLPSAANWNRRLHLLAIGGFSGNAGIGSTAVISNATTAGLTAPTIALDEGAVTAVNDGGHADPAGTGAYAMSPDGTINGALWQDISSRATHVMAIKVKALTLAYYGSPQQYAYLEGCSGGGRQGIAQATKFAQDFDGIVAGAPSISQTQFFPADLWPRIVIERDLGGVVPTSDQIALVSGAAVRACDSTLNGQHDGYISEPGNCRYDPARDTDVLCTASGGSNATSACVSTVQAQAFNKMWYGPTPDGAAPAPATDNGYAVFRRPGQLWWGTPRGALFDRLLAFTLSKDQVALNLQDSSYAGPNFINATGNGTDAWKQLSYAGFADVFARGRALNQSFADIDTESADLVAFRERGAKMLSYHGLSDQLVAGAQSSINYYTRAASLAGGADVLAKNYRLFLVPGLGHCNGNGSAGAAAGQVANPPLPRPDQVYAALTAWVEKGSAPDAIVVSTADATNSRPICSFPKKIGYVGGDVKAAASYACN